jgi:hypothetical protein
MVYYVCRIEQEETLTETFKNNPLILRHNLILIAGFTGGYQNGKRKAPH